MKTRNAVKEYRSIPVVTDVASAAMAFPTFAEGGTSATDLDSLLAAFPMATAWLRKECGLLLTWTLSQPVLLAAACLFFAGAVVAFSVRIHRQVWFRKGSRSPSSIEVIL